ncbi:ABC transporter permease [Paenibacillus marinisediminis]
MTFRQIALRNIRQSWHRYSAYFFSCVFSVAIFFVYASFIFHPDVQNDTFPEGSTISTLLFMCEALIFIFSIFFAWYSSSSFLHSRKRELGLFTLLGMSKWQLRRMVLYEQLFISVFAIVTGIATGALFSKLFNMFMGHILYVSSPLPFYLSRDAVRLTFTMFLTLFLVITVISLRKIGRTEIIELIRSRRHSKRVPSFSWILALLSIASIAGGYYLAVNTEWENIVITFVPTVLLTIIGTYFLFTQFSILFIRMLSRSKRIMYRGTNLLFISQSAHRIRSNARVLFTIATLSTVVLTATATVFVFNYGYKQLITDSNPYELTIRSDSDHPIPIENERIFELAEQYGHEITAEVETNFLEVELEGDTPWTLTVSMISTSQYNQLAEPLNHELIAPFEEGAYWIDQSPFGAMTMDMSGVVEKGSHIRIKIAGEEQYHNFTIIDRLNRTVVSEAYVASGLMVIPDSLFQELEQRVEDDSKLTVHSYMISDWQDSFLLADAILNEAGENSYLVRSRIEAISDFNQVSSLALFIGMFISLLFFIASGSIIYFKLFSDLQEDQAYFKSLTRLGLSIEEIRKVVNLQMGLIFFLPCLVGSIHTLVAMITLCNLLFSNIMRYALTIVGIYIVFQYIYFLITRRAYMTLIKKRIGI